MEKLLTFVNFLSEITALNSTSYFEVRIKIGSIRKHNSKAKTFKEEE
jgi:hypothetical protein